MIKLIIFKTFNVKLKILKIMIEFSIFQTYAKN